MSDLKNIPPQCSPVQHSTGTFYSETKVKKLISCPGEKKIRRVSGDKQGTTAIITKIFKSFWFES